MLHSKLFFIRKIKGLFIRFKLHLIFYPLFGFFLNLAYLSKLSKWKTQLGKLNFDDFYNPKVKYSDRFNLHDYIFQTENLISSINFIEFGVAKGESFKWWLHKNKNTNSKFIGFDTFTGLPEDFGVMKKPDYDTRGNFPIVNDDRAAFIAGMFQKTLPAFLEEFQFEQRKNVLHLDADLYSSTLFILTQIIYKLKKDDIIIFDEFGVPTHEFKAWNDFISAYQIDYEVIGAVNNYLQIAIRIV